MAEPDLQRLEPTISLVVAMARDGVIGRNGDLPWRLSTDLKRFKAITMGKPMVMGRKTWESFPRKPLPGRTNIIVTRDPDYAAPGAVVVDSLGKALDEAARSPGGDEICVIGGGEIFAETIGRAHRLYVTHIDEQISGDTFFPPIDGEFWGISDKEHVAAGEKDDYSSEFVVYQRRS